MNKDKIKSLKVNIQKEIWRLQMCDYLTESSYSNLHQMRKELKDIKRLK